MRGRFSFGERFVDRGIDKCYDYLTRGMREVSQLWLSGEGSVEK
jgi:hypothetical protein